MSAHEPKYFEALPPVPQNAESSPGMSLADVVKAHILLVLESNQWNITKSARILEVDRGTLYNKIKQYGLKRPLDGP